MLESALAQAAFTIALIFESAAFAIEAEPRIAAARKMKWRFFLISLRSCARIAHEIVTGHELESFGGSLTCLAVHREKDAAKAA